MKLQLTKTAKQELKVINKRFLDDDGDYKSLTKRESLVCDAGMYVDGAYEVNEFSDLNEWCIVIGSSEYTQTYLNTHSNVIRKKIDKMLRENIITIIE